MLLERSYFANMDWYNAGGLRTAFRDGEKPGQTFVFETGDFRLSRLFIFLWRGCQETSVRRCTIVYGMEITWP
jgi:hypothetical protein